ncbi:hypothetical protein [Algivirga pacifica]|uniref:Uncharacterized protein n=1 Tax=Algivirga pacifica TaxID=1162670 RepID=A0ABP9D4V8_9BACT
MAYINTYVLLAGFFCAPFFYAAYAFRTKKILGDSWLKGHQVANEVSEKQGKKVAGSTKNPWLFAGPRASRLEEKAINRVHFPMKVYRLSKLFLVTLPDVAFRILGHFLRTGNFNWHPVITQKQLFDLVAYSSLLIPAEVSEDGEYLTFQAPKDLPLTTKANLCPAGLKVIFHIKEECLVEALWEGKTITEDIGLVTALIGQLIAHWAHPQSHVMSEKSAREITEKQVQPLEPSSRFVVALHDGLLYSPISPITTKTHLLNTMAERDSIIASIEVPLPHAMDKRKMQFRYYSFLVKARMVLIQSLKKYNLNINAEYLFNNMILHSVEHYVLYTNTRKLIWSIDGSKSLSSYFRSRIFRAIWIPDYETSLEKQRIRKIDDKTFPFYKDLHTQLEKIDKELADCILASTSY